MYIPFNNISERARVWVFASDNELNEAVLNEIYTTLKTFTAAWQSHNNDVLSSFEIIEKRFIVIAVDEDHSDISGCGIDKSMHVIQELETKLNISLTNKALLHFKKDNSDFISIPLPSIRNAIANGLIQSSTFHYNTLVTNVFEVRHNFFIPCENTWLKKYFHLVVN